jgi:magnesium chelatase family protein
MMIQRGERASVMLAKVASCAVVGLDGALVEVEVDISPGLPSFTIVGLPDTAVQEARERVRAAIRNSGYTFPMKRITVNLAPADLRKEGPAYDLPIAIGILISSEQVSFDASQALLLGELSLDGKLRHTHGILSMVALARERESPTVFVPAINAKEASLIQGVRIIPVESLAQLVAHLCGEAIIPDYVGDENPAEAEVPWAGIELAHIKGQEHAKRALEVAAAGGHNLMILGLPSLCSCLISAGMSPPPVATSAAAPI